jgi:hypothetical protein
MAVGVEQHVEAEELFRVIQWLTNEFGDEVDSRTIRQVAMEEIALFSTERRCASSSARSRGDSPAPVSDITSKVPGAPRMALRVASRSDIRG